MAIHEPDPSRSPEPPPRTAPTPEDPREHEPVRDPPVYPEHDDLGAAEVRQAGQARAQKQPTRPRRPTAS